MTVKEAKAIINDHLLITRDRSRQDTPLEIAMLTLVEHESLFFGKFRNKPRTKWKEGLCYELVNSKYRIVTKKQYEKGLYNEIKK